MCVPCATEFIIYSSCHRQPPKRRLPKQNVPIEIIKPRQFNNGNIEIIHPETMRAVENVDKVFVDEVLINGRRYRVPERVVILDFWNKLNRDGVQLDKYARFLLVCCKS